MERTTHKEREFLQRLLGNLRTREPTKIDSAKAAIEERLRQLNKAR